MLLVVLHLVQAGGTTGGATKAKIQYDGTQLNLLVLFIFQVLILITKVPTLVRTSVMHIAASRAAIRHLHVDIGQTLVQTFSVLADGSADFAAGGCQINDAGRIKISRSSGSNRDGNPVILLTIRLARKPLSSSERLEVCPVRMAQLWSMMEISSQDGSSTGGIYTVSSRKSSINPMVRCLRCVSTHQLPQSSTTWWTRW